VRVALLIGIAVVTWAAAAGIAAAVDGPANWLPSAVGMAVCLVPAIGTMIALQATQDRGPVEAIGLVLAAPLIRLVAVCLVGGLLWQVVPAFKAEPVRFWAWVLGFYLVTLVAETGLLLAKTGRTRR
jgi:membrane protease YdiL (CAAX protease family)